MILALPDRFFEGWEWKEGNRVLSTKDIDDQKTEGILTSFNTGMWSKDRIVLVNFLDPCKEPDLRLEEYFYLGNLRPIPSQEQLQKKCIDFENKDNPYSRSNDFSISKRFIALVIEGDLVQNIENKPLKVMWLEFAEYVIYGKTWDGEAWI